MTDTGISQLSSSAHEISAPYDRPVITAIRRIFLLQSFSSGSIGGVRRQKAVCPMRERSLCALPALLSSKAFFRLQANDCHRLIGRKTGCSSAQPVTRAKKEKDPCPSLRAYVSGRPEDLRDQPYGSPYSHPYPSRTLAHCSVFICFWHSGTSRFLSLLQAAVPCPCTGLAYSASQKQHHTPMILHSRSSKTAVRLHSPLPVSSSFRLSPSACGDGTAVSGCSPQAEQKPAAHSGRCSGAGWFFSHAYCYIACVCPCGKHTELYLVRHSYLSCLLPLTCLPR